MFESKFFSWPYQSLLLILLSYHQLHSQEEAMRTPPHRRGAVQTFLNNTSDDFPDGPWLPYGFKFLHYSHSGP